MKIPHFVPRNPITFYPHRGTSRLNKCHHQLEIIQPLHYYLLTNHSFQKGQHFRIMEGCIHRVGCKTAQRIAHTIMAIFDCSLSSSPTLIHFWKNTIQNVSFHIQHLQ